MDWMRLKDFVARYGIPMSVMQRAIHSEYSKQIARKANPESVNSPWLINVKNALKLWERGFI